jgi:hypothetical protein
MHVDPAVVMRILDDGSWAETDWIRHWWAGLLATSCSVGEASRSGLKFITLLSQITTIQARIFSASCSLAAESGGEHSRTPLPPLTRSAKELSKITNTHDRVRIERDIVHLADLGLIECSTKWRFFSLLDQAVITPTSLAFELYARCHGHREEGMQVLSGSSMAAETVAAC